MTVTADQPARTNAKGDPCPSWCAADHSLPYSQVHVGRPHGARDSWACAVRDLFGEHVSLSGLEDGRSVTLHLSTEDAQSMATVAAAAGADELAAAIRQAAAQITTAQMTEAEAVRKCNACPGPANCSEFGRCVLEQRASAGTGDA